MLLNWRCLSQKRSSPAYSGMDLTLPWHRERDEMVPSTTGERDPLRRSPVSPDFSKFALHLQALGYTPTLWQDEPSLQQDLWDKRWP